MCQSWVHLMKQIIGSSHSIHAIISPVGISCQDSHYCGSWSSQLLLSSFSNMHSIFQNYESKSSGRKLPAVYQLDLSMFSDSKSEICHHNHILGMTKRTGYSLQCLGYMGGPHWLTPTNEVTQYWYWMFYLLASHVIYSCSIIQ